MKQFEEIKRIRATKEDRKNTKEFLFLIGWKYNEEKNIYFKDGLKDENGKFFFEKQVTVIPKSKQIDYQKNYYERNKESLSKRHKEYYQEKKETNGNKIL